MFQKLNQINQRPKPFEHYTTDQLWCDPHISRQMLHYHLAEDVDLSSRNHEFIKRSCDWMIQRFELSEGKSVCDFGCGPGLYTIRLARAGAKVHGVDFSRNSIDYASKTAREAGLDITYSCQDYLQFSTDEKFDLITLIFCDFCVLNPEQRKVMLDKFNAMLKHGGSLLLDLATAARFEGLKEERSYSFSGNGGFWSPEPFYEFRNSFIYPDEMLFLSKHSIVEPGRTREIYNWLQHYSLEAIQAELAASGLKLVEAYSNVAGEPYDPAGPEMALVAQRL